jgi:cytochrome oxidase Cu insertion factor (SCO1/SenC/PrrC family)
MRHPEGIHKLALAALIATTLLVVIAGSFWVTRLIALRNAATAVPTLPANSALLGFPMKGDLAPDFNLVDQFGHPASLSSMRGREVVLAFIDSRCKSLCPLTANIMYDAKARLGTSASSRVTLVAINANPTATSIATVQAWSINHGMLHQWLFLTGSAQQLQAVYHQYGVYVQVDSSGNDVHDPSMYIIDAQGHERLLFETLNSNSKPDLNSEESGLVIGMRQWLPQS